MIYGGDLLYLRKTEAGRGYTVEYPECEGDGCDIINDFYLHLAKCVREYFESVINEDRHSVCRCRFSVSEAEPLLIVTVTLTLRRSGKKISEKTLTHKWRNIKQWVLCRR